MLSLLRPLCSTVGPLRTVLSLFHVVRRSVACLQVPDAVRNRDSGANLTLIGIIVNAFTAAFPSLETSPGPSLQATHTYSSYSPVCFLCCLPRALGRGLCYSMRALSLVRFQRHKCLFLSGIRLGTIIQYPDHLLLAKVVLQRRQ